MVEKQSVWDLMGTDEGGLPIHLPMAVTRNGEGPADSADAVKTVCWCQDLNCPVTRALREAHDLGRKDSREERHDAIRRIGVATAPLAWSMTGTLTQAVYLAESYIKYLEEERTILLQAMWDAREALGFDTDGDQKFHIDASNIDAVRRVADQHVREAEEFRKDYDDALKYGDDG